MIGFLGCLVALVVFVLSAKYLNRLDRDRLVRLLPPNQRHLVTGR